MEILTNSGFAKLEGLNSQHILLGFNYETKKFVLDRIIEKSQKIEKSNTIKLECNIGSAGTGKLIAELPESYEVLALTPNTNKLEKNLLSPEKSKGSDINNYKLTKIKELNVGDMILRYTVKNGTASLEAIKIQSLETLGEKEHISFKSLNKNMSVINKIAVKI